MNFECSYRRFDQSYEIVSRSKCIRNILKLNELATRTGLEAGSGLPRFSSICRNLHQFNTL